VPKRLKVQYVKKNFDADKGIDLPKKITYHNVDNNHLFIAPEIASWIAVNDIGKEFLKYFGDGCSIKEVITKMQSKNIHIRRSKKYLLLWMSQ